MAPATPKYATGVEVCFFLAEVFVFDAAELLYRSRNSDT